MTIEEFRAYERGLRDAERIVRAVATSVRREGWLMSSRYADRVEWAAGSINSHRLHALRQREAQI